MPPTTAGARRTIAGPTRGVTNAEAIAGMLASARPIGVARTNPEFGTSTRTVGVPSACNPRKPAATRNDIETRNSRASPCRRASLPALIASAQLMTAVPSTSQKCGCWRCHINAVSALMLTTRR